MISVGYISSSLNSFTAENVQNLSVLCANNSQILEILLSKSRENFTPSQPSPPLRGRERVRGI
jgi:hypothetical protein